MTVFKDLDSSLNSTIRDIQRPAAMRPLNMHSPAMEVFTDFTRQQPLMVEQSSTIDQARELMMRTHTKLLLVIDSHEAFQGVLSPDCLMLARVMKLMAQSRLLWNELTVEQVMTPRSHLRAIDFTEFQLANVGDLVATMKSFGEEHVLVVETQRRSLRGIVSAHSIARRMHEPVANREAAVPFFNPGTAMTG